MGIRALADTAYDNQVAVNEASAASHETTLTASARTKWMTVLGVINLAEVTGGTPTVINLPAGITRENFDRLKAGLAVSIGSVAELVAGSGGPTYNNVILSSDWNGKTITLTTQCGTAVAGTDYIAVHGVMTGPDGAWTVEGMSDIATITVDTLNFRYRDDTSPTVLQVEGVAKQGVSTWITLTSLEHLGQLITDGQVV
jgi:hypothetical protein